MQTSQPPQTAYHLKRHLISILEGDAKEAFIKALQEVMQNNGRGKILLCIDDHKLQVVESQVGRRAG
jgi:hypothetical protein